MPNEQRATGDTGPEEMMSYTPPAIPWDGRNGPVDQDAYVEFLGRFGGAGVTPRGYFKTPDDFENRFYGRAARMMWEHGSIPPQMNRELHRRLRESRGSRSNNAGSSTAQGEREQHQPDLMERLGD